MASLNRYVLAASLVTAAMPAALGATQLQEELFEKVLRGTTCKQSKNNGLMCEYKVDDLAISIKDAGGTDTVVGFQHSNISSKYYAVLYFGCIVVVPGNGHAPNYDRDYGVYISPMNGRVYRTKTECMAAT
jgi:hypothetical protein